MRLVVEVGAGLRPRMRMAAAGLALRGHELFWRSDAFAPAAVPNLRPVPRRRDLSRVDADVILCDAHRPLAAALEGWLTRAHALVADLEPASVERWNPADRWAWHSLHATGLVEESDAESWRQHARGLDRQRLALWSAEPPAEAPDPTHVDVEILERAAERALARHRAQAPRPAVFLDRDGTLVREVGYLDDPAGIELLPGVPEALRMLRHAGLPVVVVSNQAGVGRGRFPLRRVHDTMAALRLALRAEGVELDAITFCPHAPDDGCACRKPGTALLERAADDLVLSLRDSVMIGDKRLDVAAGQAAGGAGILVRTGYGREEETRIGSPPFPRAPDRVCDDLREAAAWWLGRFSGPT
jgi:histidinol-phosphate phosphatase family protein